MNYNSYTVNIFRRFSIMKLKKMYLSLLKAVPVCTAVMLSITANSTGSWIKGQDEVPKNIKNYRKF